MRTVNIVGMGKGKELAPTKNCWGVNSLIFERDVDVHFDMHDNAQLKPHQAERRKKIIEITNKKKIPVYSCHAIRDTMYIRYPIEDVMAMFPRAYFSNAICYMIALALIKGINEINLYGVNHAKAGVKTETYKFKDVVSSYDLDVMDKSTREYVEAMWNVPQSKHTPSMEAYITQKPAVDYWIGVADGMGVRVNIKNKESELCRTQNRTVYGYNKLQDEIVAKYEPNNRIRHGPVRDPFVSTFF